MRRLLTILSVISVLLISCTKDTAMVLPVQQQKDTAFIREFFINATPSRVPIQDNYFFTYLHFNRNIYDTLTVNLKWKYLLTNNMTDTMYFATTIKMYPQFSEEFQTLDKVCYPAGLNAGVQGMVIQPQITSIYGKNTYIK